MAKFRFAATVLIIAVLLSRVLGFLRDAIVAALFGATSATDAFYAAFTIPDILNYLVAGGTLSITFIPIYTRHLAGQTEEEGNRVFSAIVTVMTLVIGAAVVFLGIFAPELTDAYLWRLPAADRALAVQLTRILLPAQLFFYLGAIASATLFSRQLFGAAAFAPLVYNLGTILGAVLLGRSLGIYSLAWGTLAGAFVGPFLIQWIYAHKSGAHYRPNFSARHPEVIEWIKKSLPLMIGVSLVTADEWIIRYFAAADTGAISCLSYARKLVLVPIAVAGQAVGQASMPFFARLYAEGKRQELGDLVTRNIKGAAAVSAILAFALMSMAYPTVDLFFRRGHFAPEQVAPTALYLAIFALAIPLWGMQAIVSRAFYATSDTLTPMVSGTLVTLFSLPVYRALEASLGITGLVVASGLGILAHTVTLFVLLPRRLSTCDRRAIAIGTARALLLGAFAGALAKGATLVANHFSLTSYRRDIFQLALGGLVFFMVVAAFAKPFKVEEVSLLLEKIFRRVAAKSSR